VTQTEAGAGQNYGKSGALPSGDSFATAPTLWERGEYPRKLTKFGNAAETKPPGNVMNGLLVPQVVPLMAVAFFAAACAAAKRAVSTRKGEQDT
jgi:hypothetical protein